MRPPQQGLDAVDLVLLQADDRLVVHRELVQHDRLLQVRAQLQPLEHALVHRRLEDPVAALAVPLRDVHGDVGVAKQLFGVRRRAARLDEADADAGAWEHLLAVDLELCLEGAQQPGGRVGGVREVGDAIEQDGELVAAEACDRVGRAGSVALRRRCDLAQDAVAGGMAEAVVDGLELVEVDEHDRYRRSGPLGAGERMLDAVREERSVGEVRHGVVEGLVGELLLEHLALADVAAVQDDSAHVLVARAGPRAGSRTGATYRRDAAASSLITCASEPSRAPPVITWERTVRSVSSSSRSNCVPSISSTLYPSTRSIDGL